MLKALPHTTPAVEVTRGSTEVYKPFTGQAECKELALGRCRKDRNNRNTGDWRRLPYHHPRPGGPQGLLEVKAISGGPLGPKVFLLFSRAPAAGFEALGHPPRGALGASEP